MAFNMRLGARFCTWLAIAGMGAMVLVVGKTTDFIGPTRVPQSACINNLRQIDGAKQVWAQETKATSNAIPTWQDIQPYFPRGKEGEIPKCPKGGRYTIGEVQSAPTCSVKGHNLD